MKPCIIVSILQICRLILPVALITAAIGCRKQSAFDSVILLPTPTASSQGGTAIASKDAIYKSLNQMLIAVNDPEGKVKVINAIGTTKSRPADSSKATTSLNDAASPLKPSDRNTRAEELLKLVTPEPGTIEELDAKVAAVTELGKLRYTKAIPVLVQNILEISPPFAGEPAWELNYPCSAALIAIGEPAVHEITRSFRLPMPQRRQLILAYVLRKIKGKEWIGNFLSQLAAKTDKSEDLEGLKATQEFVQGNW